MIALMVCGGFFYAFAFDGFNVETATGGQVETWLAQAGRGNSGDGDDDDDEGYPCNCLGPPGYECEREDCANDEVECEITTKCHTNCGKCYLNEDGRPCADDAHCLNADSDEYICSGNCYVPDLTE